MGAHEPNRCDGKRTGGRRRTRGGPKFDCRGVASENCCTQCACYGEAASRHPEEPPAVRATAPRSPAAISCFAAKALPRSTSKARWTRFGRSKPKASSRLWHRNGPWQTPLSPVTWRFNPTCSQGGYEWPSPIKRRDEVRGRIRFVHEMLRHPMCLPLKKNGSRAL